MVQPLQYDLRYMQQWVAFQGKAMGQGTCSGTCYMQGTRNGMAWDIIAKGIQGPFRAMRPLDSSLLCAPVVAKPARVVSGTVGQCHCLGSATFRGSCGGCRMGRRANRSPMLQEMDLGQRCPKSFSQWARCPKRRVYTQWRHMQNTHIAIVFRYFRF